MSLQDGMPDPNQIDLSQQPDGSFGQDTGIGLQDPSLATAGQQQMNPMQMYQIMSMMGGRGLGTAMKYSPETAQLGQIGDVMSSPVSGGWAGILAHGLAGAMMGQKTQEFNQQQQQYSTQVQDEFGKIRSVMNKGDQTHGPDSGHEHTIGELADLIPTLQTPEAQKKAQQLLQNYRKAYPYQKELTAEQISAAADRLDQSNQKSQVYLSPDPNKAQSAQDEVDNLRTLAATKTKQEMAKAGIPGYSNQAPNKTDPKSINTANNVASVSPTKITGTKWTKEQGDAWMERVASHDPVSAQTIQQIADYAYDPEKLASISRSQAGAKMFALADMYAQSQGKPPLSMSDYAPIVEVKKDYANTKTTGSPGSKILALNTLVGHLATGDQDIDKLQASGSPIANWFRNKYLELGGDPSITDYKYMKTNIEGEVENLLTAAGVTQQGLAHRLSLIPNNASYSQMKNWEGTLLDTLQTRGDKLEGFYKNRVGNLPPGLVYQPGTKETMQQIRDSISKSRQPVANAQAPLVGGMFNGEKIKAVRRIR